MREQSFCGSVDICDLGNICSFGVLLFFIIVADVARLHNDMCKAWLLYEPVNIIG